MIPLSNLGSLFLLRLPGSATGALGRCGCRGNGSSGGGCGSVYKFELSLISKSSTGDRSEAEKLVPVALDESECSSASRMNAFSSDGLIPVFRDLKFIGIRRELGGAGGKVGLGGGGEAQAGLICEGCAPSWVRDARRGAGASSTAWAGGCGTGQESSRSFSLHSSLQ